MSIDHTAENVTEHLRQHADLVRGHDAVHPDRSSCGGVGACLMMAAEVDAERDIIERLEHAARCGFVLKVSL